MTAALEAALEQIPEARDTSPVKVLFLAGLGRSGSTIIANVLGQHPHAVSVGEVVHLWTRGLADNELCGCGQPLQSCDFWSEVGRVAFGSWDALDLDALQELGRSIDRNRYIPLMLAPRLRRGRLEAQRRYTDVLTRLYRAMREVSGCEVIVDSTKHASYGYLLSTMDSIDLRVAHLVRESQGVAHSWAKIVARPEVTSGSDDMPRYSPTRTSGKWWTYNALLHGMTPLRTPRRLVRYEDVITEPRTAFRDLADLGGLDPAPLLDLVGDDWVELAPTHTVAGNPSRFRHGRVDLRLDREWVEKMPANDRRLVTALTWPMARAYGYRARRTP